MCKISRLARDDRTTEPNLSRETKFSSASGDRETLFFILRGKTPCSADHEHDFKEKYERI